MSLSTNPKYQLILEREEQFARALAYRVVDRPEISPWLIIAPFYLIFVWYQNRRLRAGALTFSREFLVTKKYALNTAQEMVAGDGREKHQALNAFGVGDENHPNQAAVKMVRQKQMVEMDLLIDHYVRLLQADGSSYDDLVKNVYRSRSEYLEFLRQLQQAEREVSRAAVRLSGAPNEGDLLEIIGRMEQAAGELRRQEAEMIFGG